MTIRQILSELEYHTGRFPREALRQAIARRDEITPHLLDILAYAREHVYDIEDDPEYMAHVYAMFLLAQFREQRAYPLLVEFLAVPGEVVENILDDTLTEDAGRILALVCGGDTSLIKRLIEDENANEYVRSAGLTAILTLVACGLLPRQEAITYFAELFREKLPRIPDPIWGMLVTDSCGLGAVELLDDIRRAFREKLVDRMDIDPDTVNEIITRGQARLLAELRDRPHYRLVEDVIAEME